MSVHGAAALVIGCALALAEVALAGPNAGGSLILHANTSIVYSEDVTDYCLQAALDSCEVAVTSVESSTGVTTVFFAVAVFLPGSSPRLSGISFGIHHDPTRFVLVDSGSCADFELPSAGWPGTGTGTSLTWNQARTSRTQVVYWFAGYNYSLPTTFQLAAHPTEGGTMADDSTPAALDEIVAYGLLGFGLDGFAPCPPCEPPISPAYSTWPQPDVTCDFPITFVIDSTAVFIYDSNGIYQEFTKQTVTFSLDDADTLRVEGLPLFPARPRNLLERASRSPYVGTILCDRALTFLHLLQNGGGVWYGTGGMFLSTRGEDVREQHMEAKRRPVR